MPNEPKDPESSDEKSESSLRAPAESSRSIAQAPNSAVSDTDAPTSTHISPRSTHVHSHVTHCPPLPGKDEPAPDCLWRVRGFCVARMLWQAYWVRASDSAGAMAQAQFRWGKTHKYIMIDGDPVAASASEYPPVRDGPPDEK